MAHIHTTLLLDVIHTTLLLDVIIAIMFGNQTLYMHNR